MVVIHRGIIGPYSRCQLRRFSSLPRLIRCLYLSFLRTVHFTAHFPMALRQPSLTIPSTSHHEDCANTWQEISQSCLRNLEAVDVSKAKTVTSRKTFLVQFAKWQQSPNIRFRKALGDWNSIPDCLENFEQHISSLYYNKANTAYLWGMTLVALEVSSPDCQLLFTAS
jgi:hypothetical protein